MNPLDQFKQCHLIANCENELSTVSALCQDSLCHLVSMHFHQETKIFSMLINRFCWELVNNHHESQTFYRVQSSLSFHGVKNVFKKNFHQRGQKNSLNLLTICADQKEHHEKIECLFSGHFNLMLQIDSLDVRLMDFKHPWAVHRKPQHFHEHFESDSSLRLIQKTAT